MLQTVQTVQDHRDGGRVEGFQTETGLFLQFIQQHESPVWDVSSAAPTRRYYGKISQSGTGWQITSIDRQPHDGATIYDSYQEAAIALVALYYAPTAPAQVAHEVILKGPRKKVAIVVLTSTDSAVEVFREVQNQASLRGLAGYRVEALTLLSPPF